MNTEHLKQEVKIYWDKASCGTECTKGEKFSRTYFQEIEDYRYTIEPEIFSFAQFTRFYGKKVLEVGVGAGTDFTQWVRAGAQAYGIDLTQEAIDNTMQRLMLDNLRAHDLQVADAEAIPYAHDSFDCVEQFFFFFCNASLSILHHHPATRRRMCRDAWPA